MNDKTLNVQKAISFVEEKAAALEKYRLRLLLGKGRNDKIPLEYLKDLQNEDGGFPYNNEKGRLSCVNATSGNLSLIIELGLGDSDISKKTANYLFKVQGKDGGWSENEAIKQYDPPLWDLPNDLKTTMWLTANIANLLIQLSYRNSPAVQKAVGFILKNRDNQGKFAGFLHSTWISVGVFGQLEGSNSDIVKRALKVIEENIEKLDFAWCLECLYVAGIPKENLVVKRCIEELVNSQEDNGAWKSGHEEEFDVYTTIDVLKALRKYEVW